MNSNNRIEKTKDQILNIKISKMEFKCIVSQKKENIQKLIIKMIKHLENFRSIEMGL